MAGGYEHKPGGVEGVVAILKDQQRQINAIREAAGLTSAVIGSGGILVKDGGSIILDGGLLSSRFIFLRGELWPAAVNFFNDTPDSPSSYTLGGIANGEVGVYASHAPIALRTATGTVYIDHQPGTGAANTIIDPVTGLITRVTSSLRYKTDVDYATVDPSELRQLRLRIWRLKSAVEADPDTAKWDVGAIAEEVYAFPTLQQFVNLDPLGRPDSIMYDRLALAYIVVLQDDDRRIIELETQAAEQAEQMATQAQLIADLTARVAALEAA